MDADLATALEVLPRVLEELESGTDVVFGDRRDPRSAQTQYNLGIALGVRGRREEAVSAFEAALAIDPDYARAHNNLGAMLQLLGRVEPALLDVDILSQTSSFRCRGPAVPALRAAACRAPAEP